MENKYYDPTFQVTFILPNEVELDDTAKQVLVEQWKRKRMGDLFVEYKASPENQYWDGDDVAKQQELLKAHLAGKSEITLEEQFSHEPAEDHHAVMTTEAESA